MESTMTVANLKCVGSVLQAEASSGDQRPRVSVGLLHGLAVDLEPLVDWFAQQLLDQGTELVTLAPVE